MPAAYTHLYVTKRILDAIQNGSRVDGKLIVKLLGVDSAIKAVHITDSMAALLTSHENSFRAGALGPDFFPDVIEGITVSHQPDLQGRTLDDFHQVMSESLDNPSDSQLAFCFGWLTHVCADVFGHHWVCLESGDDFKTWTGTPPEVIRLHLGIEKLWDSELRAHEDAAAEDFRLDVDFVRELTLEPDSALCGTFYKDGDNKVLSSLIFALQLAGWHDSAANDAEVFADRIDQNAFSRACPVCDGTALVSDVVRESCPTCAAAGMVARTEKFNCPGCLATGLVDKNCPTCNAAGYIEEKIRKCEICRGSGKIKCGGCGGSGNIEKKIRVGPIKKTIKVTCPVCLGAKGVSCPHNAGTVITDILKRTCPKCAGAKVLRNTCPTCNGAKLLSRVIQQTCPLCNGLKLVEKGVVIACPVCTLRPTAVVRKAIDNVVKYHQRRARLARKMVGEYILAHENVAKSILAGDYGAAASSFDKFFAAVEAFISAETSFADLVLPELGALEDRVREMVLRLLEEIEQLTPEWYREIKREIYKAVTDRLIEWGKIDLTDGEVSKYRAIWDRFPSRDAFPPLRNGINLFLLAIDGCEAEASELGVASDVLGLADNIDSRCQPFLIDVKDHDKIFLPFIDNDKTMEVCGRR
jgi:hypothetical protein